MFFPCIYVNIFIICYKSLTFSRLFSKLYTGPYKRPGQVQRDVLRNQSRDKIATGMLVALMSESSSERPLIAKVKEIRGDKLFVLWMDGKWTTVWRECKKREGSKYVEWTDEVPRASVVLFDFQLTSSGKLRTTTLRELKGIYNDIDNDH